MKYLFLATFLSAISFITYAQDSNEVQIKGDLEVAGLVSKNVGKELPVGLGCEALPEKKGCSARLMCYAQSKIYNNNPASKSESIQEAREMAQLAYVDFIKGVKIDRDKNCVKKTGRLMENNQSKERISQLCEDIINLSSSGKALGLEALATKVDAKQMEVTVVVGQRCKGMDVRDAIIKRTEKSNSSGGDDDFDSIEAIEGIKSNTYELDDF